MAAFVVDADGAHKVTIRLSTLAHIGAKDPQPIAAVALALLDAVISCLLA